MSSSGRSRRSQLDSSSVASSDGFNEGSLSLDSERDEVKRKSRNLSEKKRRDQFNMLINELCSMVNLNMNEDLSCQGNKKMDKSSVLRATISFLKNHSEENNRAGHCESIDNGSHTDSSGHINHSLINAWKPSFLSTEEFSHLSLEALDAFVLVFETDPNGSILYVSESILPLLGFSPASIVSGHRSSGSSADGDQKHGHQHSSALCESRVSLYDLIHESERSSLRKLVLDAMDRSKSDQNDGLNFVSMLAHFRYRSSAPERESIESSVIYELVRIVGTVRRIEDSSSGGNRSCFVSICRLQTPKLLKELHVLMPIFSDSYGSARGNEFVSRHSLEWKFLFLDHRAPTIIGYLPFEVLGTSGYDYYHWDDLDLVVAGHQQLMQTGASTSCHYRFLTKGQQWIWLKTKYYITYHMWNSKPEFVVCTHTVIGYDERTGSSGKSVREPQSSSTVNENSIISDRQAPSSSSSSSVPFESGNNMIGHNFLPPPIQQQQSFHQSQCTLQQALSDSGIHQSACPSIVDPKSLQNSEDNGWEPNFSIECEQSGATRGSIELANAKKDLKYSCSVSASAMSNSMDMEMSVIPLDKPSASCSIISSSREQDKNVTNDCPPPPPPPPSLSSNSLSDFLVNNSNIYESTLILNPSSSPISTYPINGPVTGVSSGLIVNPPLEPLGISDEMMDLQSYAHHLQPQHPMKSDVQECEESSENQGISPSNLQNFLRRKHTLLQKQIKEQQEELKRVSEQLMMVKVVGGSSSSSNSSQEDPSGSSVTLSNSINTPNHHPSSSSSSTCMVSMMSSIPERLMDQAPDNVDLSNNRDVYTDLPSETVLQDKYLIEGHFTSPYSNDYSSIK